MSKLAPPSQATLADAAAAACLLDAGCSTHVQPTGPDRRFPRTNEQSESPAATFESAHVEDRLRRSGLPLSRSWRPSPRYRKGDIGAVRRRRCRRSQRHALCCLAARGGRLHGPDDAQAEPREADVRRRAAAFGRHRAAGSPREQSRRSRSSCGWSCPKAVLSTCRRLLAGWLIWAHSSSAVGDPPATRDQDLHREVGSCPAGTRARAAAGS